MNGLKLIFSLLVLFCFAGVDINVIFLFNSYLCFNGRAVDILKCSIMPWNQTNAYTYLLNQMKYYKCGDSQANTAPKYAPITKITTTHH